MWHSCDIKWLTNHLTAPCCTGFITLFDSSTLHFWRPSYLAQVKVIQTDLLYNDERREDTDPPINLSLPEPVIDTVLVFTHQSYTLAFTERQLVLASCLVVIDRNRPRPFCKFTDGWVCQIDQENNYMRAKNTCTNIHARTKTHLFRLAY